MTIVRLDDSQKIDLFFGLVDLRLQPTLTGQHPLDLSFGHTERWVYFLDNHPVALLLISLIPKQRTGAIEWLFVEKQCRKQGIATQLLDEAFRFLQSQNIEALSFYFPKNVEYSPEIETLQHRFSTTPSKLFVEKYRFDIHEFNPPWLHKEIPLPEGYSFVDWSEITPKEIAELEHRFDQFRIPGSLTPFRLPELVYQSCSVAIRGDGRIVGWSVCHSFDRENMEFSSLYVDPDLGLPSLGFTVLVESIRRLKRNPTKNAWMLIRVVDDPVPSWSNFIRKRLAAYALEIQKIHQSSIILINPNC